MSQDLLESVLISGASGFVGACAARALLRRGHPVHLLLRDPGRTWRLKGVIGHCQVHLGDVRDSSDVRACFVTARPQVVLHLATCGAYETQADADAILTTNIVGTQNLLEAAGEFGTSLFVQTGSSSEYGFKTHPMRESDRLEPNSLYAVAKAAQSHLGQLRSRTGAMPVVCLRLFSVYGPWEEPTRLIPTLIRQARNGLPLALTSQDTARDFVYIDDVLDALLDFPRLREVGGEIINLGSGRETKLRDVVAEVLRLFPKRSQLRWGAFPPRQWDTIHWSADVEKAERLLGWQPRHTLAEGLAKTAEWMRIIGDENGDSGLRSAA